MLNALQDYFSELESSAEYSRDFVRRLKGGTRRIANSIAKADAEIKNVANERKYVASLKESFKKEAIKLAKETLFDATLNALKKRQEFDIPIYRKPLFEAIYNSDTYLYRPTGSGFNSILRVDIDLNRTAGRLNIWGHAIKRTRQQLKVNIPSKFSTKKKRQKAAIQASKAWAAIYATRGTSSNSKYMETIRKRMNNASKEGAFWELLDKGAVPMSSDRGGYPTPANSALNFVNKVEVDINLALANSMAKERQKYDTLLENFVIARQNAVNLLAEASEIINEISIDSRKIGTLSRRAEKIFKTEYLEKLNRAITLIKQGLLTAKKLELGLKGSYRGKRFSNETLQELLNG